MAKKKEKIDLNAEAKAFWEALQENEEEMGEGAAYLVTCEQMGIDPEDGYDLLATLSE